MFATTSMMGTDLAIPDVCKIPPTAIPTPFPNMGMQPMGVVPAIKVLIVGAPAHNLLTTIPMTFGDEPGLMGGIISQLFKGPSRKLTGAFTTLFMGIPAARWTSNTMQNTVNAFGFTAAPSQCKVLVLK